VRRLLIRVFDAKLPHSHAQPRGFDWTKLVIAVLSDDFRVFVAMSALMLIEVLHNA
jgi:hypothetical protein